MLQIFQWDLRFVTLVEDSREHQLRKLLMILWRLIQVIAHIKIEGSISDFDESQTAGGSSSSATAAYVDSPTAISSLNKYLAEVGMTPSTRPVNLIIQTRK